MSVPVYAQGDFEVFMGSSILDGEIDGVIGSEWDDAGNYPGTAIEPTGTAEIWTKHDGTYLYIAIEFTADSSNPWVGIQFEKTGHMSSGADGAIFGHDRIGANEYRDISFGGFGSISSDTQQDGVGAINVGTSNVVTIELKKPLSSGDSAGADIDWNVDDSYTLIILWDSNGGGSSGGSSGHTGSSQVNRTIFINPNVIPEFSALTIVAALATIAILALTLRRKLSNS
ncbi:MAG: hypothetical protein PVI43_03910 [Candidatus Bathyarchaeota archaeon]